MTNQRWLPFLGLVFVIGMLAKSPLLIAFSVTLALVVIFSNLYRKQAFNQIIYRRHLRYRRFFPGETMPVRIEVENRKLLPVSWLRTSDFWSEPIAPAGPFTLAPSHIKGQGLLVNVFSLRWFERIHRTYPLLFRQRGLYSIGPVLLESGDFFGISEQTIETGTPEYLTVFPEVLPLADIQLEAQDPFGDLRSRRRINDDPNRPIGIREYHPEDEFRRVHWPATAHTGQLQVKVYQPVSSQEMMVCLNVSTLTHHWEGVLPEVLEQLIKVAATVVKAGVENGYAVGMISNGYLAHADQPFRVAPGRSPRQQARLFEALAAVTPLTTTPFERYLLKSSPSIPYGATLVIITALFSDLLAETLVRLKRYRRHTTVISLSPEMPPSIPGVKTVHLPFSY